MDRSVVAETMNTKIFQGSSYLNLCYERSDLPREVILEVQARLGDIYY